MVRSMLVVALATILPGFVAAQQAATHTVVAGNTLWGLAGQYYGDPFLWPRIHEANLELVENPHRLQPGWVLTIPAAAAQITAVEVRVEAGPPGEPAAAQPQPAPTTMVPQVEPERTVFFRERELEVAGVGATRGLWDVPPDRFYSAPWLIPPGTVPQRAGALVSLAGGEDLRAIRTAARPHDRLQVAMEGALPQPGARLQVFRVDHDIEDVGSVVRPTGILRVESVEAAGVVAVVESLYGRMVLGDLVRPLPGYSPLPIDAAVPATGGAPATILGFADVHQVQGIGDHAFLDAGSDEGVRIGDEYVVVIDESPEWGVTAEGRVKVVAVLQDVSTARIVHVENPVLVPGVRLRPDRRVP